MLEEIIIPDIGEGVASGKVVAVHLKPGDRVEVDDTVVELETDKAVVEIPSTVTGKVTEVLAKEGAEMKVGDVVARVETGADAQPSESTSSDAPEAEADDGEEKEVEEEKTAAQTEEKTDDEPEREDADEKPAKEKAERITPVPASPSVRRLARELGVDINDVRGSGPAGRISEEDIKSYVKSRGAAPSAAGATPSPGAQPALPDFTRWGEIDTEDLDTVRRITAQSTSTSWLTVPHVTQFDEADISGLEGFVDKHASKVSQAGGKLTVTAILAKVCAEALKKYPRFNASIDLQNEKLIFKKYVHIGIAVDTPRGLLMPVIRDADTKSITRLAVEIVDLAKRSRSKKIKPTELEGGTFSISNQGSIGGVGFTPIVLWPQVAILGVSRTATKPRWIDGRFEPRSILPLSLSYDHRVIDGADAARFLRWICECLEQPFTLHLE